MNPKIEYCCTAEQQANLDTLASYLEALPEGYQHFEMSSFFDHCGVKEENLEAPAQCGAVACAVGHGPAAGIPVKEFDQFGVNWDRYSDRVFINNHQFQNDMEWDWMFSGDWEFADNTPQGAAKRIRYFLQNGLPKGFDSYGDDYQDFVELYQEAIK